LLKSMKKTQFVRIRKTMRMILTLSAIIAALILSVAVLPASSAPKTCTNTYTSTITAADAAYFSAVKAANKNYQAAVKSAKSLADKKAKATALKAALAAQTAAKDAALKASNEAKKSAKIALKACQNFSITTTALPAWSSGQPGSFTLQAAGGSPPLIWSAASSSLPDGFTLTPDGIISGSYTLSPGTTKKIFPQFTVAATDQRREKRTAKLSITVKPGPLEITPINPPDLTIGQSYDEIIAAASGGMPPFQFGNEIASGPIPIGMQIIAQNDQAHLIGSPTAKGGFSVRVCVIDSTNTDKCAGALIAFNVKDKDVAAPTTAPTPAPVSAGKWRGYYRQKCSLVKQEYPNGMPANEIPSCSDMYCGFTGSIAVTYQGENEYLLDMGAHKYYKQNYLELTGGDIDESGVAMIRETDGYASNPKIHDWSMQFYISDGQRYVNGTYTYSRGCSYYVPPRGGSGDAVSISGTCLCRYGFTGGPATAK
jgi:hypothetical protein